MWPAHPRALKELASDRSRSRKGHPIPLVWCVRDALVGVRLRPVAAPYDLRDADVREHVDASVRRRARFLPLTN